MNSYLDTLALELNTHGGAAAARHGVLAATPWNPTPTTSVSYEAGKRLLIIGSLKEATDMESRLPETIQCYIAASDVQDTGLLPVNAYRCTGLSIDGYLGRYRVMLPGHADADDDQDNLAGVFGIDDGYFDQILDCGDPAILTAAVKPPGYHHAHTRDALKAALDTIPEMIGEFDKPKFFIYDEDICAHGRSGITGCTNCMDACPTDAIISIGESVRVNPHLCQGGGTCAGNCPSGAITYAYPPMEEQAGLLRTMVRNLLAQPEIDCLHVLFFDRENGFPLVSGQAGQLADNVLPFIVEEIGSVGPELLACALAYGACSVSLLVPDGMPDQIVRSLDKSVELVRCVLEQTGHTDRALDRIASLDRMHMPDQGNEAGPPATFAAVGDKRSLTRQALSHLNRISENPVPSCSLPQGSMFGRVRIARDACTLCMGCVSQCPGKALQAGGGVPALRFIESNCVQCGICIGSCPETALTLEPRLHFDPDVTNRAVTLKEEAPFHCISCGKAFATQTMIARMTERLKGHWMFERPGAMNRLRMCEDCRVVDMFDKEDHIN